MAYRRKIMSTVGAALFSFLFLIISFHPLHASDPHSAIYSMDNNKIFWFIIISDIHIGAYGFPGSENLEWVVTEASDVINPSFILNAGDMTDSTNWNELGYPDGPHPEEWEEYRDILTRNGMDEDFYYDIPGNHDHYSDKNFDYYLNYSIQGKATGQTQVSWTRTFDFGTYHFLGINTNGNDGVEFSPLPPYYGDNAGLDSSELTFIENELEQNKDTDLSMIFGHHAVVTRSTDWSDWAFEDAEEWTETALRYGADELVQLMENYNVLMYAYGHSHIYREEFYLRNMSEGVLYLNVASLTKSEGSHYNIVAIDSNGVSTVSPDVRTWPAVIITTPLDKDLGMNRNPYTADASDMSGDSFPIRALVFDKQAVTQVEYRRHKRLENTGELVGHVVDVITGLLKQDGIWRPMTQVESDHPSYPYLWETDCDIPSGGDYTIEVRARGSSTQSDSVPTAFPARPVTDEGCFITAAFGSPDTHNSGRKQVLQALKPPENTGKWLSRSGIIATLLSSIGKSICKPLKELDPDNGHGGSLFRMKLHDGSIVGGLFFKYPEGAEVPKPLLMASFGFLQDRWGTEAAKFYDLYIKDRKERIPAHVLILDHPTAGPFFANNDVLSIGAYDDARMWIEIARKLRKDMNITGIHLFGVSMSGQTVVHALIEDKRLGLDLFLSGMVFSIAPDFHRAPGKLLSKMKTPKGVNNPWILDSKAAPGNTLINEIQITALQMLITKQFIPHFRIVHPTDKHFEIQQENVAVFLRQACEDRISFLKRQAVDNWNSDFSLADLDSFMGTTRIADSIDRVRTPLVLVSSYDDPAVEYQMFEEVMRAAKDNMWIASCQTQEGGHFGFDAIYGKDYIGQIMRLMLDPNVLNTWDSRFE